MFTFGREHEKKCALGHMRSKNAKEVRLIIAVVDAVHDLLETNATEDAVRTILSQAFVEGGTGVWEQTGSWLRKLIKEYPRFESMWLEFANNADWKVRFRAACFIDEMPPLIGRRVSAHLREDSNKKVRGMAEGKQGI